MCLIFATETSRVRAAFECDSFCQIDSSFPANLICDPQVFDSGFERHGVLRDEQPVDALISSGPAMPSQRPPVSSSMFHVGHH